jgi:putative transposase
MRQVNGLNLTRWECKYHIVFIPKDRRKVIFGQIRQELGEVFCGPECLDTEAGAPNACAIARRQLNA